MSEANSFILAFGAHQMTKTPAKTPTPKTEIDAFLSKAGELPVAGTEQGRLIFAMDATMSRQPTWAEALAIQGRMFQQTARLGSLAVQLVYFRGLDECRASKWVINAEALGRLMRSVDCRGGHTQLSRVLKHVKAEVTRTGAAVSVFVGDAFEEDLDSTCMTAGELGMLGARVFMFQEGTDNRAERAFREIARLSGGAYFRFDRKSPDLLAELLGLVAGFAAGGYTALESRAKSSDAGRMLLSQLK